MQELTLKSRVALKTQKWVGFANLFWFAPFFLFLLTIIGRYRCVNLKEIRHEMADIIRESGDSPLVICSNHLTMIDSMLITAFAFPVRRLFSSYRLFPWNVPEFSNFGGSLPLKLMCYLGKCIYVERQGSLASKKQTWQKVRHMVAARELVNIFPEGGRSRNGRINPENAAYGIGHLLQDMPQCKVICLYLRGLEQDTYGFFPKRGESFYMKARLLHPQSEQSGRRGVRELTQQVMTTLKEMEDAYFANRQ